MFKPFSQQSAPPDQTQAIKRWVRERFDLSDQCTVMVAEIECQVPGCPPLETVVAFWGEDGTRYRFKVFKRLNELSPDDVPVKWLLPSLEDVHELFCDCC